MLWKEIPQFISPSRIHLNFSSTKMRKRPFHWWPTLMTSSRRTSKPTTKSKFLIKLTRSLKYSDSFKTKISSRTTTVLASPRDSLTPEECWKMPKKKSSRSSRTSAVSTSPIDLRSCSRTSSSQNRESVTSKSQLEPASTTTSQSRCSPSVSGQTRLEIQLLKASKPKLSVLQLFQESFERA